MLYAVVAVIILILDQGLKYWTTVNITLDTEVRELIPGVLSLTNIHNSGAAFGLLQNAGFARWLFIILTVAFVVAVIVLIASKTINGGFGRWMALLVLAGAVGNLIDRILHGYVVDMLQFAFFTSFPVFNIADVFITVGGVLFCLYVIFHRPGETEEEKRAAAEREARLAAAKRSRGRTANIDEISRISARGGAKKPAAEATGQSRETAPAKGKTAARDSADAARNTTAAQRSTVQKSGQRPTVEQQREDYARRQRQVYAHGTEKSEDPFAEWEKDNSAESIPVFTPPETEKAEAETPETPETPETDTPAVHKEKTRVVVDDEEMEFSLEDILNEFK